MDRVEAAEAALIPPPEMEPTAEGLAAFVGRAVPHGDDAPGEELPSADEALERVRLQQEAEDRAAADELAEATATHDSPILRLALRTLRGDVRQTMLDVIRQLTRSKAYGDLNEDEQRACNNRCDAAAQDLVRSVVTLIAGQGGASVEGELVQATIKDGVKLQVKLAGTSAELAKLVTMVERRVLVALSDPGAFDGEREPATIVPDQPGLPLGEKSRRMTADETRAAQDTAVSGQVEVVGDPEAEGEAVELASDARGQGAAGGIAPGIRKARGRRPRKQL